MSIVDVKVLKTSEFVFLVTEYAGMSGNPAKEGEVTKYIDEMGKLYARARKFAKDADGGE